ncbi:MAG: MBL fold metallo-hydrolase [Pirellulales bacterium]|nr:MBL fold metallo-hydrolase [Pirellulales bacterium]
MKRRQFLQIATTCTAALALPGMTFAADTKEKPTGRFTLWQLPPQTRSQNMCYVMQSESGRIVAIDGGMTGDAAYLRGFLAALGNKVDAWFISHAHDDHFDALASILKKPGKLVTGKIYASLPDEDWIKQHEPQSYGKAVAFNRAVKDSGRQVTELKLGQVITIDGIRFEILGVKNPEITPNAINNSSMVMHVSGRDKSVLFIGDLGAEGGRKLMKTPYAKRLPSDYVQMAHHGQNGVDKDFYKAVDAKYALWPTPRWLWDVDSGKGKGSGPWKTLEVRAWMKELGIEKNYVSANGLYRID